jgi:hypothetical protein
MGGADGVSSPRNIVEAFNGTTWSAKAAFTGRYWLGAAGSPTAAIAFGGIESGGSNWRTETFDGTAWSAGGNLAATRNALAGAGTSTDALAFGGLEGISKSSRTEKYNGAAWSSSGALITARSYLAGCGSASGAISSGGISSAAFTAVVETFDGAHWQTRESLTLYQRAQGAMAGAWNLALAFGGCKDGATFIKSTERYTFT